jgi:hypothetical protein
MVPENALASVNRLVPAIANHPGNALVPSSSNTHHHGLSQAQPQYATALTPPAQQWNVSSPQLIEAAGPYGQLGAASAQVPQIAGVAPQRQLEAPPSSSTAYPTTGQELVYQSRGLGTTWQADTDAQQIAGVAPQRQLEAPPMCSTGHPVTGQELVYQGKDLERQARRR